MLRETILLVLLLLPLVNAEPGITGITGTIEQDATMTVSGNNFGASPIPHILAWDDFDDYAVGIDVPSSPQIGSWSRFSEANAPWHVMAKIDDSYSKSGANSMWGHRGLQDWSGVEVVNMNPLDELYISFWFRYDRVASNGNIKLIQVKGTDPFPEGPCQGWYAPSFNTGDFAQGWWTSNIVTDDNIPGQGTCIIETQTDHSYSQSIPKNEWNFLETSLIQSSAGAYDGSVLLRLNGITEMDLTNTITRVHPAGEWSYVQLLNGMTNTENPHTWVDDL